MLTRTVDRAVLAGASRSRDSSCRAACRRCRSAAPLEADAPVVLAVLAGDERMQRRVEAGAAAAGTSWIWPSVIMMAPPSRSGGTSDSAWPRAANSRCRRARCRPRSRPNARRARRIAGTAEPLLERRATRWSARCARRYPGSGCGRRSRRRTLLSGSRSSSCSSGLATASRSSAKLSRRSTAPRFERQNSSASSTAARSRDAPQQGPGHEGQEFERPAHRIIVPNARAGQGRAPGRPCSCRSVRTSRC